MSAAGCSSRDFFLALNGHGWRVGEARIVTKRMKATKQSARKKTKPMVEVKPSGVHGKGVFARQRIPKGTRMIEYTGERISWKKAQDLPPADLDEPHHTFFFSIDDGRVINAAVGGNDARWINHSCTPNCKTIERKGRVYIVALRNLKKGEELFYDYCLEPAERRTKKLERIFGCHCGSADCRGTMLEPVD